MIEIKGYELTASNHLDGKPISYGWGNGAFQLIVWYSSGRWRHFVRRIAYMAEETKYDKKMLRELDLIGMEAARMLNSKRKKILILNKK